MIEKLNKDTIHQDIEKYVGTDPNPEQFLASSIALVGDKLNELIEAHNALEAEVERLHRRLIPTYTDFDDGEKVKCTMCDQEVKDAQDDPCPDCIAIAHIKNTIKDPELQAVALRLYQGHGHEKPYDLQKDYSSRLHEKVVRTCTEIPEEIKCLIDENTTCQQCLHPDQKGMHTCKAHHQHEWQKHFNEVQTEFLFTDLAVHATFGHTLYRCACGAFKGEPHD